ncbi:MAG: adenylate/guanylate cyclase domain-containing protein [Solirubrobacterales bacterium]
MALAERGERLTFWQRLTLRRMLRKARKGEGEPLTAEDWDAYFRLMEGPGRVVGKVMRSLPASPRCGICGAPFAGVGGRLIRPLGYRPSRKNPQICATCVELAPPGGITTETGVLFADLRGFTSLTERSDPQEVSVLLRRFYACAEDILFPKAIIDKLIGDEVMALYLPIYGGFDDAAALMLEQADGLLRRIGYGTAEGPFAEVGIGLDLGEAFVGNVGERSLFDFTAIGDVVNVAARLQGEARGGEVVLSGRLADRLEHPPGERVELTLKGKDQPVPAYRIPPPRGEAPSP